MSVFKAYIKIAKKNIWMIVMYMGIFFLVTVTFQKFLGEKDPDVYRTEQVPIGIVDEDGGRMAQSLKKFLGQGNEIKELDGKQENLQENLFYRNVDYIVRIPEGFVKECITGNGKLKVTAVPGTYAGSYIDQQINNFINFSRSCMAAGMTEEETADVMAEREQAHVELENFDGTKAELPAYNFYYRYMPFLILNVICYVFGYILLGFNRKGLPDRMKASAVPVRKQTLEGLLASGGIAVGIWAVTTVAAFLVYGKEFLSDRMFVIYILNSLALLFVAWSLAYLIGTLVKNANALSGMVNTICLGMCFLCGVLVDMEVMASGVKRAAQFLPVYWYETVNYALAEYGGMSGELAVKVVRGIGIQLVFAAAFVCITLAASQYIRNTEKKL